MSRLVFTTEDMSGAARELAAAAGELVQTVPRLVADATVLMPPAVIAEAESTAVGIGRELAAVSELYGSNAADLFRRVVLVDAVDGAGLGEGIGGFAGLGGRALNVLDSVTGNPVYQWLDLESGLFEGGLSVLEATGTADQLAQLQRFESLGVVRGFRAGGNVMTALDLVADVPTAYEESAGENVVGRTFTLTATAGADVLINRNPITAGANAMDFGALGEDAHALIDMTGRGISTGAHDAEQAVESDTRDLNSGNVPGLMWAETKGFAHGFVTGANQALNIWAQGVYDGKSNFVLQGLAHGENWVIDRAYGPVSSAVSHVTHFVGSASHTVTHLWRSGLKGLGL